MFPWLWINATKVRFPLSGAVEQDLSTDAFFEGIKPGAGVPAIEKRVFEQASYGKQLGWLTDLLLAAIGESTPLSPDARDALAKLKTLQAKAKRIKDEHREDRFEAATALLDRMQAESPAELARVLRRYVDVET
jgi:hypothetical protein